MKKIAATLFLAPALVLGQGQLNTPPSGSVQSGSNVIEGYHCDADRASEIYAVIDDTTRVDMLFPYERRATQGVCGHASTGFMVQYFWTKLTPGSHVIRLYIDGVEFDSAVFDTVALGDGFIQPAQPDPITVNNWPNAGETTDLCWKESLQDWGVCGYQAGDAPDFNRRQTEKLIGTWRVQYTHSGVDYEQVYRFPGPAIPHPTLPGEWGLLGYDTFGNLEVGALWFSEQSRYGIVDPAPLFDRLFVFNAVVNGHITGCYHQITASGQSRCVTFNGERTSLKSLANDDWSELDIEPAAKAKAGVDALDMLDAAGSVQ